jgi:hypothetical protein
MMRKFGGLSQSIQVAILVQGPVCIGRRTQFHLDEIIHKITRY